MKKNINLYTHVLERMHELYKNIGDSKIFTILRTLQNYNLCFDNFKKFTKYDLSNFSNAIYDKPGWAYLDFKGNFSKIFFTIFYKIY